MRKAVAVAVSVAVLVAGIFVLNIDSASISGTLFVVPYSLGPLFVTIALSLVLNGRLSQAILAISSLCYGAWFGFVYIDLLYHPDAQNPIAFLFIGIYSLPWIWIFWVSAFFLRGKRPKKSQGLD